MNKIIRFPITGLVIFNLVLVSCTNTPKGTNATNNEPVAGTGFISSDSLAVLALVKDFFKAFDERDTLKLNDLLGPSTKIIHHNGATTNREEMQAIIKETKNWWPRTRKLSDFECIANADVAIVGCNNVVTFSLPVNKKLMERYRETWVYKKIDTKWTPVRIHYSKVTVDKHSEEVN